MAKASFLSLPRPIVTCILSEKTVADAVATIRNGEFEAAHAFAIHLELLGAQNFTDENFRRLANATRRPIMFLHYRGPQHQPYPFSDDERVDILKRAVLCGATAIDLTADTFDPSPLEYTKDPRAVDKQRRTIDEVHEMGAEVVMSSHIYEPRTCEQVVAQMKDVESRGVDFAKIVTLADTEEDFLEALKTTLTLRREMRIPFIHLCNGRFALPHRYFSPTLGNGLTFCVERYSAHFVTAQPPVKNMRAVLDNINWHVDP